MDPTISQAVVGLPLSAPGTAREAGAAVYGASVISCLTHNWLGYLW